MNRRHMALVVAGFLGLVLLTPLKELVGRDLPFPDFALIVVLYTASRVKGSWAAGGTVAVLLGYLADLFSGAPKGLYGLTLGLAYYGVRLLGTRLSFHGKLAQALSTGLVGLVTAVAQSGLAAAAGPYPFWGSIQTALTTVAVTALFAPLGFSLLERLDRKMAPEIVLGGSLR